MKVLFFCPVWGSEDLSIELFAEKVKAAGYDGVEISLPAEADEKNRILKTLEKAGLLMIAQHWETADADFNLHKANFEKRLYHLADAKPLFINTQTGKDFFTFEQNCELIELATAVTKKTGVNIVHETHRGKFSFAAHITRRFLEHSPYWNLTLDISHWCNVAESLLENQEQAVSLALARAVHIHARVGFAEGPQIPDPRAEQWQQTVDRHLYWWDQIIDRVRDEGRSFFTITSEFGPFPYMQIHPETSQPLTDQWDVNVYMKDLLNKRYNG